jgi:3'-5' exoribonuclease
MGHAIREMKEGESYEGVLWLVAGQIRQTKNGDPFWEGTFQDATGSVGAKLWDSAGGKKGRVKALSGVLEPGRPLHVQAVVDSFQGTLQLNLSQVRAAASGDYDPEWFSPRSARSEEEMVAELDALVAGMGDPDWRRLLKAFRDDHAFFSRFCKAPAAKAIHHAWVGGLLEHALALSRAAMALSPLYPALDRDLVLCGCFLHDAGKTLEISADPGFEYTVDGKLHGHIYMGARLAEQLCDSLPGFPEEKRRHLVHLILSHQGDRSEGFGSAADPATPEAVFFHHLDNLDAKVQHCLTSLQKAEAEGSEAPFTSGRGGPIRKTYYRVRPGGESPGPGPAAGGGAEEAPEGEEHGGTERDDSQPRLW